MVTPSQIASQSLDAIGSTFVLGDIEEGTRNAQVILRAYGTCLRQLLRAAPWAFARREVPLLLLADATGDNPNVGTQVPDGFVYSYAYPTDCVRVRFIPWNHHVPGYGVPPGNIAIPNVPIMTGLGGPWPGHRPRPARWLLGNDVNNLPAAGTEPTHGVSPTGRLVILTDVKDAHCVYTTLVVYPDLWDELFRAAFVAYLASEIALPLTDDKKFGLELRNLQIQIAKQKLDMARVSDGNEGFTDVNRKADWMRARNAGLGHTGWGRGGMAWGADFDRCSFADGTAY